MRLQDAARDIRYLLDTGYPQKAAVSFVCNHYQLDKISRHLLSRMVIAKSISESRGSKFSRCNEITGHRIIIDGYNIIIGMESILEKKAILCDDGVIRDIKGVFSSFKISQNTRRAIELVLSYLKVKNPLEVLFLLDSRISKSGALAELLREKISYYGLTGDARTSEHADYDIKNSLYLVASSDGAIIDESENVINFLYCLISEISELQDGISELSDFQNNYI